MSSDFVCRTWPCMGIGVEIFSAKIVFGTVFKRQWTKFLEFLCRRVSQKLLSLFERIWCIYYRSPDENIRFFWVCIEKIYFAFLNWRSKEIDTDEEPQVAHIISQFPSSTLCCDSVCVTYLRLLVNTQLFWYIVYSVPRPFCFWTASCGFWWISPWTCLHRQLSC